MTARPSRLVGHRGTVAKTVAAGAVFFSYAGFAPSALRGTLLLYAGAATCLVAIALVTHRSLTARLGSVTAVVAIASAVFLATSIAALAADPCPVGGDGRCSPAGAGATGFAAMLVPLVVYVTYRLGAWTLQFVGRVAAKTITVIRRTGNRGAPQGDRHSRGNNGRSHRGRPASRRGR